jgi:S-methylmethionine-dependent homocysteine/selenocysteine methylase
MKYRNDLPQLRGVDLSTSGGMETWLQYAEGFPLRHFCAFEWLRDPKAKARLREFHRSAIEAVQEHGFGMIAEGIHYRASGDWGDLTGYSRQDLAKINAEGVDLYHELAREYDRPDTPVVVGGCIGPRGDAYEQGHQITADEAQEYHAEQMATLKDAGVDLITAATLSFTDEAIGIARAAQGLDVPVVLSFYVAGNGKIMGERSVPETMAEIDAATGGYPKYYMLNCAHPNEFAPALENSAGLDRLGGFMPNASAKDKISLCRLGHLEDGDPVELGQQMGDVARRFPHVHVFGGCCGTDARHLGEIAKNVSAVRNPELISA